MAVGLSEAYNPVKRGTLTAHVANNLSGTQESNKRSLDFIITRTFMKIFQTSSVDVQECQTMFNFRKVSELIVKRKQIFLQNFCSCENGICQALAFVATDELSSLCASLS